MCESASKSLSTVIIQSLNYCQLSLYNRRIARKPSALCKHDSWAFAWLVVFWCLSCRAWGTWCKILPSPCSSEWTTCLTQQFSLCRRYAKTSSLWKNEWDYATRLSDSNLFSSALWNPKSWLLWRGCHCRCSSLRALLACSDFVWPIAAEWWNTV